MTQTQKILKHLQHGNSITAIDALNNFGCFRLAARINDLKKDGWDIKSELWNTPGGATIARYTLPSYAKLDQWESKKLPKEVIDETEWMPVKEAFTLLDDIAPLN